MKLKLLFAVVCCIPLIAGAQLGEDKKKFTKADTLRGSLNPDRDWWDVQRYDIEVKPDYGSKTIRGKVQIIYKLTYSRDTTLRKLLLDDKVNMQIDLQQPLIVDSIITNDLFSSCSHCPDWQFKKVKLNFSRDSNIAIVKTSMFKAGRNNGLDTITIYYHGTPKEAKNAPWDGGWIWSKDSSGRPWMSVAVQGLGASAWYPCKDHQSDEPDSGASLTVIAPDSLVAVANGRLTSEDISSVVSYHTDTVGSIEKWGPGTHTYRWEVTNPINNYNIIPSIGKYVNWTDTLLGEDGKLDLSFWVLDYNLDIAKKQFQQVKPMLRCFEYWFGPYPFYEDSYKLVETPFLGMEHQSAIAYGNLYRNGYRGKDLSGTGWGTKWDFIIVHESGHEWFANNITTKDIADMWVHEGFTNYSETLYTEWLFGKQAGDEYNYGLRKNISNDKPIIGIYGVNEEGSGDMYYKGGNMIHTIRKVINDDEKFRQILRGLNKVYRHQVVTTSQVENYIIQNSGINFQKAFDQYLRTTQIPRLEFYYGNDGKSVSYRWTNSVKGFDLPLVIGGRRYAITTKWNTSTTSKDDLSAWKPLEIEKLYYITAKQVSKP